MSVIYPSSKSSARYVPRRQPRRSTGQHEKHDRPPQVDENIPADNATTPSSRK